MRHPRRAGQHLYTLVTREEHAAITELARRDGLTMSNFVRRAINSYLLEGGDDTLLLADQQQGVPHE